MPALTAHETARRLIARAADDDPAPGGVEVVERALVRLVAELTGWFGPYSTHALVSRALVHARTHHPALAGVRLGPASAPVLEGLGEDEGDAAGGATELLAWVIELLGRLIGTDLAAVLVEQSIHGSAWAVPRGTRPVRGASGGADGADAKEGATGGGRGAMDDTTGSTTDD